MSIYRGDELLTITGKYRQVAPVERLNIIYRIVLVFYSANPYAIDLT